MRSVVKIEYGIQLIALALMLRQVRAMRASCLEPVEGRDPNHSSEFGMT